MEYYTNMALELIKLGADEICIKDMAGIGRPVSLGKIVANIKAAHPDIPIQYHSHAGPGFNMASILAVCEAGCDYIDVGMEPLSWGTGHADLLSVQAMLKDAGFKVPEINMEAYMKVRALIQEFMDDFLGLYISPKNRLMNSLLIGPGLPGGMMGSLMADLESNLESINKYKAKRNLPFMKQDELLIKLFNEVAYVWPRVGYPPLVTPFSQYVKNLSMMNVMAMEKGKERWGMIADDIWDMLLGKAGKLPGELAPELVEKAEREGRKFFNGNPQDNYPDALDKYRKLMKENKKEEFYDEVLRALWGYLSDKLSIPQANLTKDNVEMELAKYGVDDALIKEFMDILNTCEFARYAPAQASDAMDKLYEQTVDAIGKMENTIKK